MTFVTCPICWRWTIVHLSLMEKRHFLISVMNYNNSKRLNKDETTQYNNLPSTFIILKISTSTFHRRHNGKLLFQKNLAPPCSRYCCWLFLVLWKEPHVPGQNTNKCPWLSYLRSETSNWRSAVFTTIATQLWQVCVLFLTHPIGLDTTSSTLGSAWDSRMMS